jgi:hypothetical protein
LTIGLFGKQAPQQFTAEETEGNVLFSISLDLGDPN